MLHGGLAAAAEAAQNGTDDANLLRHVLPAIGLPLDLSPEIECPWVRLSDLLSSLMRSVGPFRFSEPHLQTLMGERRAAKPVAATTALWRGVPHTQHGGHGRRDAHGHRSGRGARAPAGGRPGLRRGSGYSATSCTVCWNSLAIARADSRSGCRNSR